jgi:hypothetical protein
MLVVAAVARPIIAPQSLQSCLMNIAGAALVSLHFAALVALKVNPETLCPTSWLATPCLQRSVANIQSE